MRNEVRICDGIVEEDGRSNFSLIFLQMSAVSLSIIVKLKLNMKIIDRTLCSYAAECRVSLARERR